MKHFKRAGAIRLVAGCLGLSSIFFACDLASASECASDAECKPGYVCQVKTEVKKGKTTTKSECKKDESQCEADADCKQGYVCQVKTEVKKGKTTTKSECKKDESQCEADADCKEGYVCQVKTEVKKGKTTTKSECKKDDDKRCEADADCKAGYHCESDGKCKKNDKCDDRDECTNDVYEGGGKCSHTPIPGCGSECSDATDCADGDVCTTEECADGTCRISVIPGCSQPTGLKEICGDCIDNDFNGLTDFEDEACCGQSFGMTLSRGRIVPGGATSRMRLKATLARTGMATVNPTKQDVFIQIRPAGAADILCARVPASKFMARKKAFKYWGRKNPAPSAQGIGDMKIRIRKNGTVRFQTASRKLKLPNAKAGALQITVGFHNAANEAGDRCSSTMASFLGAKHNALVAK